MTFKDELLQEAAGENIVAVVLGKDYRCRNYGHSAQPAIKRYSWSEAAPLLDYEYDDSYGSEDCHALYAWTATKVILIGCYDGSTWVTSVPRSPKACKELPAMVGGG